jgi:hypothetical protein
MLAEFQQALADLVAAPEFCRQVREHPQRLQERYKLSQREFERLVGMVNQRGMACNCMLYRANRLAPLALNLRELCRALGARLGPLLSEYSLLYPNTNVHFYLECDRFCQFMYRKIEEGYEVDARTKAIFNEEYSNIRACLVASCTVL